VIANTGDDRPLVAQKSGWTAANATLAVGRLEHIARWSQTAQLRNPASTIKPADVAIGLLVNDKPVEENEVRLEYRLEGKEWVPPTFKLTLANTSQRRLYCGLLDLTELFKVDAGLMEEGCIALNPGETKWILSGTELAAQVPDEFWRQGRPEFKDVLKLIVSTEEFDARLLEQDALDMPAKAVGIRGISRNSTLSRLMRQVQARDVGKIRPVTIDDWQATQLTFTTVRPLGTTSLAAAGQSATIADGVTIKGHPTFRASARLATVSLSTRDLGGISLPRILRDDPAVSRPLTLATSRGTDPGISVLELTDVDKPASVTPDSPLKVTVPFSLTANEHVLPLAYDGEFFVPLGRVVGRSANATEIALDRLPPPLADTRSLTGAIKIFFQKVISRAIGTKFEYPILAAAEVSPQGTVNPIRDTAEVRKRVAAAKKILLFVHGIIGDTRSMVPSVQLARLANAHPLASLYDVILTFDYENLNTTIEDNGRALKARLETVGLAAGHGKALDIAAHSMGGLVSRWFIEREAGNQIARRLIMLGTPNGGSPWPAVFDWATIALGLALNNLTTIAWPATAVGALLDQMENPTVALNEMLSSSKVLAELKASADPGIPYIMLAGNTSIIPAATAAPDAAKPSVLSRLLARLTSPTFLHDVANPFFHDQANDVAVSVTSMKNIADGRAPAYNVRPVACDHLSYFNDPAGLKALAQVLSES
jgi:pimeloyl-ACP methyl ester carboxylesterase